jgi:AbrB family looped-hinge helix DNA binding protein
MQLRTTYPGARDMKEHQSVVTRKGQITIPVEFRKALNIKEGDKVAITMDEHEVRVFRTGSVVEATAGALKSDMPPLSPQKEREAAEEVIAKDVIERMNER